ncbi:hypothetical protein F2P44_31575 [Massilia sp. CCM 8695]|uniref:DUF3168 domain-containing protein n=1 Tax=Massilia frigida TaxID=2609281 RepID=A0ABX0NIS7_9BURK|nr:hypothetical protein [Massilia frigida]NHZ83774.1 hypothetical protein [Massilia frigida]
MSAVKVIRALLIDHAPLAALIEAGSIYAGTVPVGVIPAISIKEITRVELGTASRLQASVLVTSRIQVTVHAKSYPEQKALMEAAKLGSGVHTGVITGVVVRSVLRDVVGADMYDDAAGLYQQTRDFKVVYIAPN